MKESCRKTLERVYLFLDAEQLNESERSEIQQHLDECAPCFERYGVEKEVAALVARVRNHDICPEHVKNRIAQLIQEL